MTDNNSRGKDHKKTPIGMKISPPYHRNGKKFKDGTVFLRPPALLSAGCPSFSY
jgi:hypothetical protein